VGTAPTRCWDPVRHADLDDVDEVIRLAGLMYEAIGRDAPGEARRQMRLTTCATGWATTSWWLWSTTSGPIVDIES
jgi:hypothetical protein